MGNIFEVRRVLISREGDRLKVVDEPGDLPVAVDVKSSKGGTVLATIHGGQMWAMETVLLRENVVRSAAMRLGPGEQAIIVPDEDLHVFNGKDVQDVPGTRVRNLQ